MKLIPPPCLEPDTGPKYWRGLDQIADTPEFRQWLEREFPAGASEFTDPLSRRHFVKIMSASFLLAGFGLTGCRRPEEKILPFSKMPENYAHGVAQFYATAMPNRGSAVPLVVKSDDGRPTKLEGNALHPDSNGGTDRFAQASILNLYDPDRAMRFAKGGNTSKREEMLDFLSAVSKRAQANGGEGLCFLLERSSSPSRARLQKLTSDKFPRARWFLHEPVDFDIHRQAASLAFGKAVAPYFKFDEAKVIVSLDCDFIGSEQDAFINIRRFAKGRKIEKPSDSMSRLYAVEALFTLTGANADHRLRLPASQVLPFAARLAAEVLKAGSASGLNEVNSALSGLASTFKGNEKWVVECAKDLAANAGQSLVLAGYGQPLAAHLIANALNSALGNIGKTVVLHEASEGKEGTLSELAQALNDGRVDTLVMVGGNPVYAAPADLNWAQTQRKARTVVRLGYYEDETFPGCDWHLPQAHYLESWGDARTADGTFVPIQPLIEPLFGGMTELEVIARIGGLERIEPYDIVRETFRGIAGDGEDNWKRFLHDGHLADSAAKPVSGTFSAEAAAKAIAAAKPVEAPSKDKLEVVFHRDYKVDDGRYTNNGWLQELPDPITKLVWENVVLMSLKTATDLGIEMVSPKPSLGNPPQDNEDNKLKVQVVKVQLGARAVEGPVWVQPGMADHVIGLGLGYGRLKTGRIGHGSGYDAYRLRVSDALHIASGARISATGRKHPLSATQSHWAMEGRPIVREANLEQYRQHPDFTKKLDAPKPPVEEPLYPNPFDRAKAKGLHQWGMAIDLNACVGCSACMMACQSENNVPIVGKYLVGRSREMHWIRIDRYYAGSIEDPQSVMQPMLCQHCEAAPCENVCPVNATVHDEEGLNVMAYNRCVGTRYCSNNCPYKVRRFNYLDYNRRTLDQLVGPFYPSPLTHKTDGEWDMVRWFKNRDRGTRPDDEWELLKLVKNPDVTVRMRGVMEKCSFCVQRIEQAKIAQKVKAGASGDVRLKESEGTTPKTACQQACPAGAIVFGDISDPESQVSKLKAQERNYTVLDFLLTKPRTTYLARLRNPNPQMPDYHKMPLTLEEYSEKNKVEGDPFAGHGGGHGSPAEPGKGAH